MNASAVVAHGTARSGYAQDIMPGNTTMAVPGSVLPPASLAGRQVGRTSPAAKRYGQAKYEAVTLEEAMSRMSKRAKGELPPIVGGLDDPNAGRVAQKAQAAAQNAQNTVASMLTRASQDIPEEDEWGVSSGDGDMDGFEPVPLMEQKAAKPTRTATPVPAEQYGKQTMYLAHRRRITMELSDSTVTMSIVDMIHSRYGITIIVPQTADGMTFIPKPGSEITLREGDKQYAVYFPGTYFDLPALGLVGLSFVKAEESA